MQYNTIQEIVNKAQNGEYIDEPELTVEERQAIYAVLSEIGLGHRMTTNDKKQRKVPERKHVCPVCNQPPRNFDSNPDLPAGMKDTELKARIEAGVLRMKARRAIAVDNGYDARDGICWNCYLDQKASDALVALAAQTPKVVKPQPEPVTVKVNGKQVAIDFSTFSEQYLETLLINGSRGYTFNEQQIAQLYLWYWYDKTVNHKDWNEPSAWINPDTCSPEYIPALHWNNLAHNAVVPNLAKFYALSQPGIYNIKTRQPMYGPMVRACQSCPGLKLSRATLADDIAASVAEVHVIMSSWLKEQRPISDFGIVPILCRMEQLPESCYLYEIRNFGIVPDSNYRYLRIANKRAQPSITSAPLGSSNGMTPLPMYGMVAPIGEFWTEEQKLQNELMRTPPAGSKLTIQDCDRKFVQSVVQLMKDNPDIVVPRNKDGEFIFDDVAGGSRRYVPQNGEKLPGARTMFYYHYTPIDYPAGTPLTIIGAEDYNDIMESGRKMSHTKVTSTIDVSEDEYIKEKRQTFNKAQEKAYWMLNAAGPTISTSNCLNRKIQRVCPNCGHTGFTMDDLANQTCDECGLVYDILTEDAIESETQLRMAEEGDGDYEQEGDVLNEEAFPSMFVDAPEYISYATNDKMEAKVSADIAKWRKEAGFPPEKSAYRQQTKGPRLSMRQKIYQANKFRTGLVYSIISGYPNLTADLILLWLNALDSTKPIEMKTLRSILKELVNKRLITSWKSEDRHNSPAHYVKVEA